MKLAYPILAVTTSAALLSACASGPKAPPRYNASASPQAQAAQFIEAINKKGNNGVQKVGLTTCQVAFATHQSGSSQTSGHFFDTRKNTVEAKVRQHYYLKGISDAELQSLAEQMCAEGERQLIAAGFDVVPSSQIRQMPEYQEFYAAGTPSPFKTEIAKTEYTVVAPAGFAITDESTTNRAAGGLGGIANAFKQAGGANAATKEATLGFKNGFAPARLLYTVDVASIEERKGVMGVNNTAEVSATVNLQVGGQLMLVPLDAMGKRSPRDETRFYIANSVPTYLSKLPVTDDTVFYSSVEEVTSTGDKLADGFSKVVGFAAALAGGTGMSTDTTRYNVNVRPELFSKQATAHAAAFVAMAAYSAK